MQPHDDHAPTSRTAEAMSRTRSGTALAAVVPDIVTREPVASTDVAQQFVQAFAEAWARPTAERLAALMHPDVRLAAPMMRATVGKTASLEEMRRLLLLWPDVHVEVERWSGSGDVVFIEFTMIATFAARPLRIPGIDRIVLKDGLAFDRVTYVADPLSMLSIPLLRPSGWLRWWRAGVGLPRRRCRLDAGEDAAL